MSIVIPAYNEEKRIDKTLERYLIFFKTLKRNGLLDFEIIVVLNGCKDNTLFIVEGYRRYHEEMICLNFRKAGKGFAILEGFKEALKGNSELIGFVDADMATPPEAFYDLVENMGDSDGVIASRWLKESKVTKRTLIRKITSKGFNILARTILFLKFSDTQCGAKLFKREVIEKIAREVGVTEWAFDVDLLYRIKKRGFKVKEIPTVWEDKRGSGLNLTRVPFRMFSAIIRLRLLHSPFEFIVRAYDKLPERIKVHHKL